MLEQFGVKSETLAPQASSIRPRANNRVVHIDADFTAYQIAADTREEKDGIRPMRDLDFKLRQIEDIALMHMETVGASKFVLHVTPSGSNKGGRAGQAVQKEYQANRLGRDKPEHLDIIRAAIAETTYRFGYGVAHLDQEADDGLVQANIEDINNSIILTRDKDLRMAYGWHYDPDTDDMIFVEPDTFGDIWIDDTKSSKKVVGYGPAFFWAQCLMGDTADNIAGLPKLSGYDESRVLTPEIFEKQKEEAELGDLQKKRTYAKWNKLKSCGPVATFNLLNGVNNNKDAFHLVRSLFQGTADMGYAFQHWKTGSSVSATQALLGDMLLLWMRRTKNPNDVVEWLKGDLA